jgi:hypothetical protein
MMNRTSRLKIATAAISGALAMLAAAPASAYVIGFETNGLPIFAGGDPFSEGDYNMTVLDSPDGFQGAAGRITDGSDPHACDVMQCPSGNSSYYYMGLNDGGLVVQRSNPVQAFQLKSLDYTFVAPVGGLLNFNYGQLRLSGQLAGGGTVSTQFDFPTQDADGVYTFGHSALLPAFSNASLTSLTISACLFGADNTCYNPAANQAQFGIDNLNVTAAVPEPETYAMLLAGLAAMGALSRRRTPSASQNNA